MLFQKDHRSKDVAIAMTSLSKLQNVGVLAKEQSHRAFAALCKASMTKVGGFNVLDQEATTSSCSRCDRVAMFQIYIRGNESVVVPCSAERQAVQRCWCPRSVQE